MKGGVLPAAEGQARGEDGVDEQARDGVRAAQERQELGEELHGQEDHTPAGRPQDGKYAEPSESESERRLASPQTTAVCVCDKM